MRKWVKVCIVFACLTILLAVAVGVGWYVYRQHNIQRQDEFLARYLKVRREFRLQAEVDFSKNLAESDLYHDGPIPDKHKDADKKMKLLIQMERECQQEFGMELGELFYRYNERYPWKPIR